VKIAEQPSPTSLHKMPLVAAQPGIWVADQLASQANSYLVAHYVDITQDIDVALMQQAIALGLQEADSVHLRFDEEQGVARQWLQPEEQWLKANYIDLYSETGNEQQAEQRAHCLMQHDLDTPLSVTGQAPLYCHCLYRVAATRYFWYQRYHHLLVDGFSFSAISQRIGEIYTALYRRQPLSVSPFTSFESVVDEYLSYACSPERQRDHDYWQQQSRQLAAAATLNPQPLDGVLPTTILHRVRFQADRQHFQQLLAAGNPQLVGALDLALALLMVWLSALSGQQCFTSGMIMMRRLGSAALSAGGSVINVLPMTVDVDPHDDLLTFASQLHRQLQVIKRHQRYDAEQIQRDLGRSKGDQPLYGTVFNCKVFDHSLDLAGAAGRTHFLASGPVRDLEITLYISEEAGLEVEFLANSQRYSYQQISEHVARLSLLLAQLAAQPQRLLSQCQLLTEQEQTQLQQVNASDHPLAATTLVEMLAAQALKTPQAVALVDERYQLSYQQMRQQVAVLAQQLAQLGVKRGDIVAVALPRSVFLTLALHAVLEVGAAYLPLDLSYPDSRLSMMLSDARPTLIITHPTQQARFSCYNQVLLYDALLTADPEANISVIAPTPQHAAYMIFTSGSTGRPKGVVVDHQAIVNRLCWMQHQFPLSADDAVLQKTPCSFDVSVWEFFWPLMVGARLVMAPPDAHRDPQQLLQCIVSQQITTLHFVPSMLAAFVASLESAQLHKPCPSLRQVFASGEALPVALATRWQNLSSVALYNLYGPTEAAVDVSWYPAYGEALMGLDTASVPIGWPVWNTGLHILDSSLRPVVPGVAGELYLTGVQLAQGYFGRPLLSAGRFVASPYGQGERMYRTGDVARRLPNGAIEYLGRSDFQLKIRGQRIELPEIDHCLQGLPGVAQAVTHACVLHGQGQQDELGDQRQLVGYLVAQPGQLLDVELLREQLLQQLPAHMVPVALIELEQLPLSANGKLDRLALPLPQLSHSKVGRPLKAGAETLIAGWFVELLGCDKPSAQDDFFSLGGHSLLAMRLAAQMRSEFALPISVGQIMGSSRVEQLAQLVEGGFQARQDNSGFAPLLPLRESHGPVLFCLHPASGFSWQFSVLPRYLPAQWSVVGVQSSHAQGPLAVSQTMLQLCQAHLQTLRQYQPHGPYHLLGYSLGGVLALGMAALLQQQGEQVAFLGLLDTYPPESQNWQSQPDEAVLAEVARERQQFFQACQQTLDPALAGGQHNMFDIIERNYEAAVRLLGDTQTAHFTGKATLFAASQSLQPGQQPAQLWQQYIPELEVVTLDCAHVDMVSPHTFAQLGPQISQRLPAK